MVNEDLKSFMSNITVLDKERSEYFNKETGTKYIVPNSYLYARCDYLELTNDELKKERFAQNINKEPKEFNQIESTRPVPKYETTKREEDKYIIIDGKVKVNQIWRVTNGMQFKQTFNNKDEALKLLDEINEPLKKL
jgi:hypothetical protein